MAINNIDTKLLSGQEVNRYFAPDVEYLYHYTSIEALINGIIVKKPNKGEELCLRATHNRYMNDPTEFEKGIALLNNLLSISNQLYGIDVKGAENALKLYKSDFYFVCFSEEPDNLPMWNMYGSQGHGVALKFEKFQQEQSNDWIIKCDYLINNVKSRFEELNKISLDVALTYLVLMPFILKNPAYSYEKETRFVGSFKDVETYYRYRDGMAVPYKNVFIDKCILKSIVIGPAANQDEVEYSLRSFLDDNGLSHVVIERSQIPYRS